MKLVDGPDSSRQEPDSVVCCVSHGLHRKTTVQTAHGEKETLAGFVDTVSPNEGPMCWISPLILESMSNMYWFIPGANILLSTL